MSIQAAVAALNKEIATLDTKRERLVVLRDALIRESDDASGNTVAIPATRGAKRGPKPGSTKKNNGVAKKGAPAKKATATKRVMSPEARKRIADAQKARWAKSKAKTA